MHALTVPYSFSHTKPEKTSGQTSGVQASQVLVTDITKPLQHAGSEVFMGGEETSATRKTPQHNCCRKLFHISDSKTASFFWEKQELKVIISNITEGILVQESESQFIKITKTPT